MTKKQALSLLLACLIAASSLSVLTSCNKEVEPTKEKRTNVYSGTSLQLPEGVNYVERIAAANGNIYVTYYKEYTITYNELGEEVERRAGYYWEAGDADVDGDMVVEVPVEAVPYLEEEAAEEESSEEAVVEEIIDADGDAIADGTLEITTNTVPVALTAVAVETPAVVEEGNGGDKLPDGWWYNYESVQTICIIPLDGGQMTETSFNFENSEYGWLDNLSIAPDGAVKASTSQWTYDEETGMSSSKYYLLTIDPLTGDIISDSCLNDSLIAAGLDMENTYINSVKCVSDGTYYITTETDIVHLDENLGHIATLTLDSGWIDNIYTVGNDKLFVHYYVDGAGAVCKFIENGQFVDIESETLKSVFENYYGIIGTSADFIYYDMDSGVWRYDFATDSKMEVMNYINSDIDSTNRGNMVALEDGRIVMTFTDWEEEPRVTTVQVLEKVPDELLQEEIIVRLGTVYSNYNLIRAIIRYNKQNTGIRIAVQSYAQYNNEENEWKGAVQQLNNDIITGKVPDMIYLTADLPVESYFQKGIFADLNEFIDDPEIGLNRADYLANVFEVNSTNGKLYSMILNFTLRTLVAESKYVGTEPGWTFEEMMSCIHSMPEGMLAFFDMGRDDIVRTLFNVSLNSFVDWETGKTQFDSQGFIDLINYLASCPEKGYWDAYYESMDSGQYTYDEELDREMQENYSLRFYKNMALFNDAYISSYNDYLNQMNEFASKDITAIGYPTMKEGANGAIIIPSMELAISATSSAQKEAWEILKFFMTDEKLNSSSYRFSINNARNETNRIAAADSYYYSEPNDDDYTWYYDYGFTEEYINYIKNSRQPFDQAAVDYVQTLIEGAAEIKRNDADLVEIITEELSTFFAGTRSAEETARIIASRASIYISENS